MRYVVSAIGILRAILAFGFVGALTYMLAGLSAGSFRIRLRRFGRSITIRGRTSDRWVLNSVLVCEEYRHINSINAKTIVDAGANIGCATIWFKHQFPQASIVALEPDPENYRLAVENTRGLQDIKILCAGLWGTRARLRIVNPDAWRYALRVEESIDGPIQAESVLSIMEGNGWSHIDILKMDIEGAEASVLAHDVDCWIGRVNVLIIELHQDVVPECGRLLCAALAKRDFKLSWRGEDLVAARITPLAHHPNPASH